jgi:hypothetical protein
MFTFHRGVYVDPKVVYDTNMKTTNLMLGVGLNFSINLKQNKLWITYLII